MQSLHSRPVLFTCIILALLVPALVGVANIKIYQSGPSDKLQFTVEIKHFGIDPKEIERSITIPLEDQISSIRGTQSIESVSEADTSRVMVSVANGTTYNEYYIVLRDAVDRVYSGLPKSAQKPIIYSGASDSRAIFIVALKQSGSYHNQLYDFADKTLKPNIEKIQGVGQVVVGGGEQKEVHIELNANRMSASHLSATAVASAIQNNHFLTPVGLQQSSNTEIPIKFDSTLSKIEDFESVAIPISETETVSLGDLSTIQWGVKERTDLSRIDGISQIVVYVKSSGIGSITATSQAIRAYCESSISGVADYEVIYDFGAQVSRSFWNIIGVIAVSMVLIVVFLSVILRNLKAGVFVAATLPFNCVVSIGWASLCGYPITISFLSGTAIGIGAIADSSLLIVYLSVLFRNKAALATEIASVRPAIIASLTTSVVVLVPILSAQLIGNHIKDTGISYGIILVESVLVNSFLLPVLLHMFPQKPFQASKAQHFRIPRRFLSLIRLPLRNFKVASVIFAILSVLAITSLFVVPRYYSALYRESSIFVHTEFPPGTHATHIDQALAKLSSEVRSIRGVKQVESQARRENGSLTVNFDPSMIGEMELKNVMEGLNDKNKDVSFIIQDESGSSQTQATITIIGPEIAQTELLIKRFAQLVQTSEGFRQSVFHFKESPLAYSFNVDASRAAKGSLSTQSISETLRWAIQGPVGVKWIDGQRETDVRIFGSQDREMGLNELKTISLTSGESTVLMDALGQFRADNETGRTIFRYSRQRGLSMSVYFENLDIRTVLRTIDETSSKVGFPTGYSYRIDESLKNKAAEYENLLFSILIALFLILTILCIQYESFTTPIVVISAIVPSFFTVAIGLLVFGISLNTNILVAIIIVAGIVANNAILITEQFQKLISGSSYSLAHASRAAMRATISRFGPLFLTVGASSLAALPFIIVPDYRTVFLNQLSVIVLLGSIGSFVVSVFLYPAWMLLFSKHIKPFKLSENKEETNL